MGTVNKEPTDKQKKICRIPTTIKYGIIIELKILKLVKIVLQNIFLFLYSEKISQSFVIFYEFSTHANVYIIFTILFLYVFS